MSLKQRLIKILGLTDKAQATSVREVALMQSNGIKGDDSKQSSISLCFIAATLAERSRRSSGAVRDLREAANDEIWRVAA